jgi:quinol monooxygenase YgiN
MIITVLAARIMPEYWQKFRDSYEAGTKHLPAMILETFLVQDHNEQELWRIITVWKSYDALQTYRQSVSVPDGVLWFRAANAEPSLALWDVIYQAKQDDRLSVAGLEPD